MSGTIVLIHGAWVTPASWEDFPKPFEAAGWRVLTPSWPLIEGLEAAAINAAVPDGFGALSVSRIADHLEVTIRALPEPPVLVGHSFGGLLVQMLLHRGVGVAGVAINPAPIGGVVPGPTAFKAIAPIMLRPFGWRRPYRFTRKRFGRLFANAAPAAQVDRAYASYVIPAPGRIFHDAALWLGTFVDPAHRTQPLLITGGSADRLTSPYLTRAAFSRQRRAPARTDYHHFAGRSHFLCVEPGWEDVARIAVEWIESLDLAAARPAIAA